MTPSSFANLLLSAPILSKMVLLFLGSTICTSLTPTCTEIRSMLRKFSIGSFSGDEGSEDFLDF